MSPAPPKVHPPNPEAAPAPFASVNTAVPPSSPQGTDTPVVMLHRPGWVLGGEISRLVDRGYQKFLKTSKLEIPATADDPPRHPRVLPGARRRNRRARALQRSPRHHQRRLPLRPRRRPPRRRLTFVLSSRRDLLLPLPLPLLLPLPLPLLSPLPLPLLLPLPLTRSVILAKPESLYWPRFCFAFVTQLIYEAFSSPLPPNAQRHSERSEESPYWPLPLPLPVPGLQLLAGKLTAVESCLTPSRTGSASNTPNALLPSSIVCSIICVQAHGPCALHLPRPSSCQAPILWIIFATPTIQRRK